MNDLGDLTAPDGEEPAQGSERHRPRRPRTKIPQWKWIVFGICVLAVCAILVAVLVFDVFEAEDDDDDSLPLFDGVPAAQTARDAGSGIIVEVTPAAHASGVEERPAWVYVPRQYWLANAASKRFPVLYLLHGVGGDYSDWQVAGEIGETADALIAGGEIGPLLIVLADYNGGGGDTECLDTDRGPAAETYLTEDVVDAVDATFRTLATRQGRAIGGNSTGGYCGIRLVSTRADEYSAAVSLSGTGVPDIESFDQDDFGELALSADNTPAYSLLFTPITAPTGIYLSAGADDPFRSVEDSFVVFGVAEVRAAGGADVCASISIEPHSGHDWNYWSAAVPDALRWLSEWFTSQTCMPADNSRPSGECDSAGAALVAALRAEQAAAEASAEQIESYLDATAGLAGDGVRECESDSMFADAISRSANTSA